MLRVPMPPQVRVHLARSRSASHWVQNTFGDLDLRTLELLTLGRVLDSHRVRALETSWASIPLRVSLPCMSLKSANPLLLSEYFGLPPLLLLRPLRPLPSPHSGKGRREPHVLGGSSVRLMRGEGKSMATTMVACGATFMLLQRRESCQESRPVPDPSHDLGRPLYGHAVRVNLL
jgi:hypothetical protein